MVKVKVTIVVVPRERFSCSRRSLESVYECTRIPFRLVYVDGGSPGYVRRYLEREARRRNFDLVRTDFYLSPNRARNIGLKKVQTDYVVFLDNDVIVATGWLEALIQCAEETSAWVVGPLTCEGPPVHEIVHCAGGECHISVGDDGEKHIIDKIYLSGKRVANVHPQLQREKTELVEFHCMLVKSEVFDRIGPLDEEMLNTREHVDFCLTVAQSGGSVYSEPAAVVTYLASVPLKWTDIPFYELRWSKAWLLASLRHLREKWSLAEDASFGLHYSLLTWRRDEWVVMPLSRKLAFGRHNRRLVSLLRALDERLNTYIAARYERIHGSDRHRLSAELAGAIRYSLTKGRGILGESIVSKTGKAIRIIPGAMDGAVDAVTQQREHTRVSGWASDDTHRRPADQVAVFINGEAEQYGHTTVHRSELAEAFRAPSLLEAGFEVVLSGLVFTRDPAVVVRVFAISPEGVASELEYRSEYYDGTETRYLGKGTQAIRHSLTKSGGGLEESIVSKTGKTVRIVRGAMDGTVDVVTEQREHTRVSGWASDGAHRGPVNQVAVFVNGETNHYGHTVVRRPDLVEGFKTKSLLEAGFEVILPRLVFDRDPSPLVRVFAISPKGVASELRYPQSRRTLLEP